MNISGWSFLQMKFPDKLPHFVHEMVRKSLRVVGMIPPLKGYTDAVLFRQHTYRWHWQEQEYFRKLIFPNCVPRILSGPFQEMIFPSSVGFGSQVSKWLGTYECELTPYFEQIIDSKYDTIIDIVLRPPKDLDR